MNGVSNYQYGAYNAPYASSYQKERAASSDAAKKSPETKETDASTVAKGTKESIKNAGVANILGSAKSGRVTATQSEKYGTVVGEPKLSEKAEEYYNSLKKKFGNMDFVLVSKDQINAAKAQAGSFGNPNRTVVLIDEEKLEKMATDESYRKKYEGIISMSQSKIAEMAKSFAGNPNITSFGMNVDSKGNTSFFATVSDTSKGQKERIEKHRAEKKQADKEQQAKMKKKAEEKKKSDRAEKKADEKERLEKKRSEETFSADTIEDLIAKIQAHSYSGVSGDVRSEAEKALGGSVDFSA